LIKYKLELKAAIAKMEELGRIEQEALANKLAR